MSDKIRLKNVIKKFNISLKRVVNFLNKKGIKIENNPNTKIEKNIYELILKKFQNYKKIKDQSEEFFSKNKKEKEEIKKELKNKNKGKLNFYKKENNNDRFKSKKILNDKKISEKTEHIDTVYQKLDGVILTGDRIDLSQFERKKTERKKNIKKKRKRIKRKIFFVDKKQDTKLQIKNDTFHVIKNDKKNVRKRKNKNVDNKKNINKQIKETLEKLSIKGKANKSKHSKSRKEKRQDKKEKEILEKKIKDKKIKKILKVAEFTTVNELSSMMKVNPSDVIMSCMSLGIMVTLNQRLDAEILTLVSDEFGYDVEFVGLDLEEAIQEEKDLEKNLVPRPPIITVMGHVDHGKTSLLDCIRKTNVIAGEYGGITQHIAAYSVKYSKEKSITFLDTPGHEAFTAMRARGTQITDIAIIVIASDDNVMPQTKEAISHAQIANVPIIFVLNKIDKPNSNPNRIKEQLSKLNFLVEDWGGKYPSQNVSAKTGTGINDLLEKIIITSELLELKANPKKPATGTVIEASLDKGKGYITTLLVQNGTLKIGDYILTGKHHGKVKNILDERGISISYAGPSKPIIIIGLNGAPNAGEKFKVFKNEKNAKQLAIKREQLQREQNIRSQKYLTLDEAGRRISSGDYKEIKIILKGDTDGSVEAISSSIQRFSTENRIINIIHKGIGQITESDVLLANASNAIIIGFNVRPNINAKKIAKKNNIEIRTYSIIYDIINDIKKAIEGMLTSIKREKILGNAEIREIFKIPKIGIIAGCMVTEGKLFRKAKVRLIRKGIVIYNGEFNSLKRFKEDIKEVNKGYECGLGIKNYNDLQQGDVIEVYE